VKSTVWRRHGTASAPLDVGYLLANAPALAAPHAQGCFGLMCEGIADNMVDRAIQEHVVDFLAFQFGSYVNPTFKVPDSAI
jgi:lipoprotein signal peptidase